MKSRSYKRPQGFTLLELLVATVVSLIIVTGLIIAFQSNTKLYGAQSELSQLQQSLRVTMQTIKEDIERAGFLTSPDTYNDPRVCEPKPYPSLPAIWVIDNDGYRANILNYSELLHPDTLILTGNYTNSEIYWASRISSNTIELQANLADPNDPYPQTEDEFNYIFNSNALLKITPPGEKNYIYARISGRNYNNKSILTTQPLPIIGVGEAGCGIKGLGEGSEVSVVNVIAYVVENPLSPRAKTSSLSIGESKIINQGGASASYYQKLRSSSGVLARYVVDPTTFDPNNPQNIKLIPESREVVAENVVDFQVWFRFNNPTKNEPYIDPTEIPPGGIYESDPFPSDQSTLAPPCNGGRLRSPNCRVDQIRSAIVKLVLKSSKPDPDFVDPSFISDKITPNPYRWYRVDPNSPASSRVRMLITEITLPNLILNSWDK